MLKDITLGQYFPGESAIHRLDPRAKLLITIVFITALFLAQSLVSYAVVLGFLTACILISGVRFRVLMRSLKPLLFVIALTGILNLFYTTGDVLVKFWIFTVTKQGIRSALLMMLRISMLVTGTFLLTYTTSPVDLTDGLERLLRPLNRIHVPVHALSMMMFIALRFIPTLMQDTDKIISAQKARGGDFETGNLIRRAKALIPILVPLFISAFRRADELATAMECRCYHGGDGRTKMHELHYRSCDLIAFFIGIALLLAVIFLRHSGV